MSLARSPGAALAVVMMASCSDPDPIIEYRYGPYEGDAYPDRRPEIEIPEGGMGVVTDSRSDTISLVSLATGERFGAYPVGREPVTIDGPHHVAVDAAGNALYVALSYPVLAGATGPHTSHGESLIPGYVQKLALDDMRVLDQVRVDSNPGDIVLSEDGRRAVVSHYDLKRVLDYPADDDRARSALAVIDTQAGLAPPVLIPVCMAAHGVALSRPHGDIAYVACYGEDALAIVDLTDPGAEVRRIPVGPSASLRDPSYGPYAAVMSPDQKTIAVSNLESRDVRFFDVASGGFVESKQIFANGVPYFVAWSPDSARVYVPMQSPDMLVLVDLAGNSDIVYRELSGECDKPHVAELDEEYGLFVVCEGDQTTTPGKVLRLDPETLETLSATEVGLYPDAFVRVAAEAR